MNLLEVKKATVRVQAVMDLIRSASSKRLTALLTSRDGQPHPVHTPESKIYDQGWKDGLNAGLHCGMIEIQDLDAEEVIAALDTPEDEGAPVRLSEPVRMAKGPDAGGHRFVNGACPCGHKTSDDPAWCSLYG